MTNISGGYPFFALHKLGNEMNGEGYVNGSSLLWRPSKSETGK